MKFSPSQMRKLGLEPSFAHFPCNLASKSTTDEFNSLVLGRFRNVIIALFNSDDGYLDNDYANTATESAHPDVQRFLSNWLLKPVTPLPACSTHEEALNMIIPRSAQTSQELSPYMDKFTQIVKEEYDKYHSKPDNSDNNGGQQSESPS